MHLSKLTVALKAFSEPRFKRLKEYVHSPYFKVPAASVALFDYLYPLYPDFAEKKIKVKLIAQKAANLRSTSCQSWAATQLLHSIEQFIGLEHHRAHPTATDFHQLHGAKELGLFEHFHKDYSHIQKQLDQCPRQHTDTFYHRHLFAELRFNAQSLLPKTRSKNNITPAVASLDQFYAVKKLHYLCEAFVRGQINPTVFPPKQILALLKTLEQFNSDKYPHVYLFMNVYRLLTASTYQLSLPYYNLLKEYASSKSAIRDPQSAIPDALPYIIHHCLYWFNKGEEQAGKEYLWWIELKMENAWLLEEKKLPPVTFRNILLAAVNHKSAAWMEEFIAVAQQYLPPEELQTNLSFANGLLNYRMKKFKEAMRHFMMAEAKDNATFHSTIRRWQWICSYESDCADTEALENQLISFEKYVNRNKRQLGQKKKAFEKFIFYARSLWSVSSPTIKAEPLRLLQSEKYFPGKHWLLKQFENQRQNQLQKAYGGEA